MSLAIIGKFIKGKNLAVYKLKLPTWLPLKYKKEIIKQVNPIIRHLWDENGIQYDSYIDGLFIPNRYQYLYQHLDKNSIYLFLPDTIWRNAPDYFIRTVKDVQKALLSVKPFPIYISELQFSF